MLNIKYWLSAINRIRKKKFPAKYVSQKKFNNLKIKYETLIESINSVENPLKKTANIKSLIPFSHQNNNKELCLFLSYSPSPKIKPHVKEHIEKLVKKNISVILIINTDYFNEYSNIELKEQNLCGLYIRENIGFDFGAWSEIYTILEKSINTDALYLINDSIIGPLSEESFNKMISEIRASSADFIGLTSNTEPEYHIQSFFLVIRKKILNDYLFNKFFKSILNLPSKEMVIDFYETKFTKIIKNLGYKTNVIYKTDDLIFEKTDSSIHNSNTLINRGFPYIKASITRNH